MSDFQPMRESAAAAQFSDKDVLVVFGELFQRGYANGIVDEAKKRGMKVIYATVGRRDENEQLRPLTAEELSEKDQPLINIPLEAGFDLEPAKDGTRPVDQLKGIKMSAWDTVKMDWEKVEESRQSSIEGFRSRVQQYLSEVEKQIPDGANVVFVHTMAGGFPRAKVVMPAANRVFKGYGDRYTSSEHFWNTDIGRFCDKNFKEVTGETFRHLIELSSSIRERVEGQGKQVSYVAYGYHGTDVLIDGEYKWQAYSPYLQGFAKLRLEEVAVESWNQGIKATVFNAPEILTNSSSIFLGVEVSLYPLLGALRKEASDNPKAQEVLKKCESLLQDQHSVDEILDYTHKYLTSNVIQKWSDFKDWPKHNGPEQMELMRTSSAQLIDMHKDTKELITAELSEVVFRATGELMINEAYAPRKPVWWLGHDIIAKHTH